MKPHLRPPNLRRVGLQIALFLIVFIGSLYLLAVMW